MDAWQEPEADTPADTSDRRTYLQTGLGILVVLGMHLVVGLVMLGFFNLRLSGIDQITQGIAVVWFFGLSVVQVVYVLPAMFYTRFRLGRSAMSAGMLIGAALTVVLQTACYGFFCVTMGSGF
ncbi:MAG: hypothetical protein KTR31_16275 [Myxococcales bacterium]|nr:hypothetical protein [Myxococcales bacterium]